MAVSRGQDRHNLNSEEKMRGAVRAFDHIKNDFSVFDEDKLRSNDFNWSKWDECRQRFMSAVGFYQKNYSSLLGPKDDLFFNQSEVACGPGQFDYDATIFPDQQKEHKYKILYSDIPGTPSTRILG